jgi:hypothetical protein
MKLKIIVGISVLIAACAYMPAQAPANPGHAPNAAAPPSTPDPGPVPLDWVPPALDILGTHAASKSSLTFDRSMLTAAAALMGNTDDATKQAVAKLDGVSLHMLRFTPSAPADPAQIDAIRQAYHLRGWKHVITTTPASGGPITDGITDVWVVLDGVNIRGAVVLVDSPQSLTLATISGNLSPEDLLHLRGKFGIPRFEGDDLGGDNGKKENGRQIQ